MWIHISKIAKTIIFSTQTDVENFHKLFFCKTIHNYCRKHGKFAKFVILHNRMQISEKFSPIVTKIGIFLKCHSNCSSNKCKLLTHKIPKAAINCSHVYCEEDYGKCYKHTPLFFKHTIVSTSITNAQITKTNKTCIYCKSTT